MPNEKWKVIENYPLYSVSNLGRVKCIAYERSCFINGKCVLRFHKEQLLKPVGSSNGYQRVVICKDGTRYWYYVHRLVARAFVANPHGYNAVNHIDENKINNCAVNLEWVTTKQNLNYGTRNQRASQALKGRKRGSMSEETKAKLSAALKGRKRGHMSEEQKAKISSALKGKIGKKVSCSSQTFSNVREAAEYFNEVPSTFRGWLNGRRKMPEKYKKINLRYID